jgi:hypothetical protein
MPYYEYRCPSNSRVVEVRHRMDERLATWGEVAVRAGLGLGETHADAPVERLLSVPTPATGPVSSGASSAAERMGGCGPGCACARPA